MYNIYVDFFHVGIKWNEMADEAAFLASKNILNNTI